MRQYWQAALSTAKSYLIAPIFYVNALFFIGAIMNFIPHWQGGTLKDPDTGEYPDFILNMRSFQMVTALAGSVGASLPILLDFVFDLIYQIPKASHYDYIPRREIVLALIFPDLLCLLYIIPYQDFDVMPGLIGARDTLFICAFLSYMHKLSAEIWSWQAIVIIGIPFSVANVVGAFRTFSADPICVKNAAYTQLACVGLAYLGLIFIYIRWFIYYFSITDSELKKKINLCNIYVVAYGAFIIGDWLIIFIPNSDPSWSLIGPNYFSMYTYLMTVCTIIVTLLATKMAKMETIQIQETLKIKKMFMRYISHEVRTPMSTVFTGLKVLETELLETGCNQKQLDTIEDIKVSAHIALGILNDMLLYDKIEGGLLQLELSSLRPFELINDTAMQFMIQAREKKVKLTVSVDDAMSALLATGCVKVDKTKFCQVMRNLLSNGLKFTKSGGAVTVAFEIVQGPTTPAVVEAGGKDKAQESWLHGTLGRVFTVNAAVAPEPTAVAASAAATSATASIKKTLKVTVTDTGAGISQENQAKLFTQIIQFNPGKLQGGGGTGLGLYISYAIMSKHDGKLGVFSAGEGHGCTFSLELPMYTNVPDTEIDERDVNITTSMAHRLSTGPYKHRKSAVTTRNSTATTRDSTGISRNSSVKNMIKSSSKVEIFEEKDEDSMTVLLVDDSSMNRKMVVRLLNMKHRDCTEASDGVEAVELVGKSIEAKKPFDVVLMDYQMPNMDGPTAIAEIRRLGYTGLIIGLTGNALSEDLNVMRDAGADSVLVKPFDVDAFDAVLNTMSPAGHGAS